MINVEVSSELFWLHMQFKSISIHEILTIAKFYKVIWTETTLHYSITDVGFLCAEPLTHFTLNLIGRTLTIGAILTSRTSVISVATRKQRKR